MSDGFGACLHLGVKAERPARERRVANWLASLGKHFDYLRNRYDAFPVRDEHARAAAMRVLDYVRRKELNRVHGRSALESAAFVDADVRYDLYAVTGRPGPQAYVQLWDSGVDIVQTDRMDLALSVLGRLP